MRSLRDDGPKSCFLSHKGFRASCPMRSFGLDANLGPPFMSSSRKWNSEDEALALLVLLVF